MVKVLARLPDRLLYVMPRALLLSLFIGYVSFMFFSSCAWFKPLEEAVHGAFFRLSTLVHAAGAGVLR
ncbi:hypothetical protein [Geobacter pickeringii]|uniref:Uncharacterized protein n=1 Tax=Geobacter pickeringii TaxID=345632 RepID=A0A0B5BA37_9BACT|nr:hypothetical protein [Geobacter pickeringii]AJE03447.1 hypothetical protein GPICK_08855 [Geobacter pickeringii]